MSDAMPIRCLNCKNSRLGPWDTDLNVKCGNCGQVYNIDELTKEHWRIHNENEKQ